MMSDALRYEWMRLRTLRSTYWLVALSLLVSTAVALSYAIFSRVDVPTDSDAAVVLLGGGGIATFMPVLMAIIGILATGHEYRYGLIQPTLTAVPQRSRLIGTKLAVVAMVASVVVLTSLVINGIISVVFWGSAGDIAAGPLNQVIPGYVVLVVLYAILGAGLAQLFRSVPWALVVVLVVPAMVEPLIQGLAFAPALDWLVPVVKFLPFSAGSRLSTLNPGTGDAGPVDFHLFDRWTSGGIFALFVGIVVALAWTRFLTRDA